MLSFAETLRSAAASIRGHGLRSGLTALGLVVGVASVIAVVAIVQGLSHRIKEGFAGLGANSLTVKSYTSFEDKLQGRENRIGTADLDELVLRLDGVRDVSPVLPVFGPFGAEVRLGSKTAHTRVFATTPVYQYTRQSFPAQGRFITEADEKHRRRVAVVGAKLLDDLDATVAPIGKFVEIGGEWFKIVGVMEERGELFGISQDDFVLMPFATGLALLPDQIEPDIGITFNVDDVEKLDEVRDRAVTLLRRKHGIKAGRENDFKVETAEQLTDSFASLFDTVTFVFAAIVGISMLVGGIGVMNMMLVSVTERTREIGIRKALGAKKRDILAQFLIEAVLLTTIGGVIGIGVGYALGYGAAQLIPSFPPAVLPWWATVAAFGFSAAVGIVFGIAPAARAAALDPMAALRNE